jgi:hypothetical protein
MAVSFIREARQSAELVARLNGELNAGTGQANVTQNLVVLVPSIPSTDESDVIDVPAEK